MVRHAKRERRFTDCSRVLLRPLCSSFEMQRSLTGCLISRPRYSARPIIFGSRGPSEEASSPSQGVATYTSELTENAWEKGYSWYIRLFSGGRTRMALIISVYVIKVIMKTLSQHHPSGRRRTTLGMCYLQIILYLFIPRALPLENKRSNGRENILASAAHVSILPLP